MDNYPNKTIKSIEYEAYKVTADLIDLATEEDWTPDESHPPVKLLWSETHFDGVATGIAEWNNQKCYFYRFERNTYQTRYLLVAITEIEFNIFKEQHEYFQKEYGYHTDYILQHGKFCNYYIQGKSLPDQTLDTKKSVAYQLSSSKEYRDLVKSIETTNPVIGYFCFS